MTPEPVAVASTPMDWTGAALASLALTSGYLFATRKEALGWSAEQRERSRRWRKPLAVLVGIGFFVLVALPLSAGRWLLAALLAAMVAYLVRHALRKKLDRRGRSAIIVMTVFCLLVGAAPFVPGTVGIVVFAAGVVVLVVGAQVFRRMGRSQRF